MKAISHLQHKISQKLLTGKRPLVLALFLGAIYPLGFSPIDIWPFTLISMMGFFWLLQNIKQRFFLTGLSFGFAQFVVGGGWVYISIHEFGNASAILALIITFLFVLYLGSYAALFSWLYGKWFRKSRGWYFIFVIAFLWLVADGLRGWVFSGFPWLYSGYAFIDTPLANWAPIVGVHGIAVLAIITAILLLQYFSELKNYKTLLSLILIWFSSWLLGMISWSQPVGKPITTTLVQPSIPQQLKWNQNYFWKTIDILKQHTDSAKGELIIWPEGAVPAFEDQVREIIQPIALAVSKKGQTIITGIPIRNEDKSEYYNGAVVISDELTEKSQQYLKRRLVPFGEYVPLQDILRGLIEFFDLPMSAFSLGPEKQLPFKVNGINFGMAICYEITFPQLVYSQAQQSSILLTISNDAWFGTSWGPEQHLQMARMRAREISLPILRATNDGVSAIINEKGMVVQRLEKYVAGNLEGTIQPQKSSSWVMHYHPWWTLVIVLGLMLLIFRKSGAESET